MQCAFAYDMNSLVYIGDRHKASLKTNSKDTFVENWLGNINVAKLIFWFSVSVYIIGIRFKGLNSFQCSLVYWEWLWLIDEHSLMLITRLTESWTWEIWNIPIAIYVILSFDIMKLVYKHLMVSLFDYPKRLQLVLTLLLSFIVSMRGHRNRHFDVQ